MKTRPLGKTRLEVSELCMGCWQIGGLSSAEDAYRKIRLGASVVQLYSALVFRGPGIVREVNAGLARLLARDGLTHVAEAVGIANEAKAVV